MRGRGGQGERENQRREGEEEKGRQDGERQAGTSCGRRSRETSLVVVEGVGLRHFKGSACRPRCWGILEGDRRQTKDAFLA